MGHAFQWTVHIHLANDLQWACGSTHLIDCNGKECWPSHVTLENVCSHIDRVKAKKWTRLSPSLPSVEGLGLTSSVFLGVIAVRRTVKEVLSCTTHAARIWGESTTRHILALADVVPDKPDHVPNTYEEVSSGAFSCCSLIIRSISC